MIRKGKTKNQEREVWAYLIQNRSNQRDERSGIDSVNKKKKKPKEFFMLKDSTKIAEMVKGKAHSHSTTVIRIKQP